MLGFGCSAEFFLSVNKFSAFVKNIVTNKRKEKHMEKKFKFSDKPTASKIIYATVIAILCISAVVIGIVVANGRKPDLENTPPTTDEGNQDGAGDEGNDEVKPPEEDKVPEVKLTFVSPTTGTVAKSHSTTVPVFSNTLDEWRIHTGLDITTEDGAEVFASAGGEVTKVYNDPMLGKTVEITHSDTHKTLYSNLDGDSVTLEVGAKVNSGDVIGKVGDTAIIELADEPHLHFEMLISEVSVNPLDYIDEDSKESSLGIVA